MEIDNDFKEFIQLLNECSVKYLVIGGYAVNYYGYPRYTKDIDFWIWMTEDNIKKLLDVLDKFGFANINLSINDFMSPNSIIQLGYEPYRIDLLVDVEGLDFEKCYSKKNNIELEDINVDFLSLTDLIEAKKISGRLQDLADAEKLEQISKKETTE